VRENLCRKSVSGNISGLSFILFRLKFMIVVFTNGCFDIIHPGHIDLLERARAFGDKLIVGINSDDSVRAIKGAGRPLVSQEARAAVLRGLRSVDEVVIYDEPTPQRIIEEIKPDVLVKGGDWAIDQIIGADFVLKNGGKVFSLPLFDGFSSSSIIEKLRASNESFVVTESNDSNVELIKNALAQHHEVFNKLADESLPSIIACGKIICEAVSNNKKILLCGNGGSAADSQHIATELVGRYEQERRGLPAIALTVDTSALTAIGNDYGFERVFARQVEALANEGDVLIGISTSGNSPNVIAAVMTANNIGCKTIGLTGATGKKLAGLCHACVLVPSTRTSRIQEAHITIGHIWCEMVEKKVLSP
jgi:D-sedoheptulose 7-phosphate isomerase